MRARPVPGRRWSCGEGCGKMERVQAAQVSIDGERGGVFSQSLVDLDDAERRPLFAHRPGCLPPGAQRNSTDSLSEPDAADEPAIGFLHGLADELAAGLGHIALDQSAGVQVQVPCSASRSASTSEEAGRRALTRRGACLGRARAGATRRPSAISWRSRLSPAAAPAGTISATGRPRRVTRACSPRPTSRRVLDKACLSSRTPISRM
jgi:hypothetical protein